ncbi:hypothetical protein NI385_00625 [Vibrio parahaemolyticus]|nr:hypothetical protein NI385_00625 [Vibrio parahaemolyticus]
MDENVLQIDRLVKALLSHPEVMEEHFGINVSDYDIVPVILNCMPFSWKGKYKNVYFTDSSSLNRFLASGHINAVVSKSKGKQRVLEKSTVYKLWESETPSADDLIRQFENPIQLQGYLKSRVRDRRWFPSDNTSAFTVDTFYTDNKLLKKNEKKIFGINELPKKKKIKNLIREKRKKFQDVRIDVKNLYNKALKRRVLVNLPCSIKLIVKHMSIPTNPLQISNRRRLRGDSQRPVRQN